MNTWPVARRALRDLRWTVLWYGAGLGLYAALTVWTFPAIESSLRRIELPPELLKFFGGNVGNLARPSSYLSTRYQSFAPLVLSIYAVVASTGLLSGEEGRGSLDGVLAQPISRTRVALESMTAFLFGALVICVIILIGWFASVPFVDLHGDITLLTLVFATFSMMPMVALFGALGFLCGAITPSRGIAAGILTGVAVASYLGASFARIAAPLEWLQYITPYYYADSDVVLTTGVVGWHVAVLIAVTLMLAVFATLSFRGREIGVRTWQPLAWIAGFRR
jgi:ABC-2 type transport system permease protein